jgi:tRNA(Ser,Leu) C12 N-acetylase TAN1
MWAFNVIVTTGRQGRYRQLLEELAPLGEFRPTEFFGVIVGKVEDLPTFLETLRDRRKMSLIAFQDIGRVIPLEQVAVFRLETFLEVAREAIRPFLGQLAGRRFYVRLERRGHKGQIISPEAERALDAFIKEELAKGGETAAVDFDHPEMIVAVETLGDRLGVGLLTGELLERYELVRIG